MDIRNLTDYRKSFKVLKMHDTTGIQPKNLNLIDYIWY